MAAITRDEFKRVRARMNKGEGFEAVVQAEFNGRVATSEVATAVKYWRTVFKKANDTFGVNYRGVIFETERPTVPVEVEALQIRRLMLRPITVTALLCGDPLPGESALDRRSLSTG